MLFLYFAICFGNSDSSNTYQPSSSITYQPSGIYDKHITRWSSAVSPAGDVYLLNKADAMVYRFTPQGTLSGVVGGRGRGPGEYLNPEQVFVDRDQLFIVDQGGKQISCYHLDGTPKERFSAPIGMVLERIKGNWIYGSWRFSWDKKQPVTLYMGDNHLVEEKALFNWPRTSEMKDRVLVRKMGEATSIPFNPVSDFPKMVTTFSGDYAYIYQPGPRLRIHVVDLARASRSAVIDLPVKPAPFNSQWATALMKQEQSRQEKKGHFVKHVADFPQYFPPASLLCTNEQGHLVIGRMVGGNQPMDYLSFDYQGRETASPYPLEHAYRIIAVHGEHAWVSVLGEDGQAAVVRTPITGLTHILTNDQ